MLHYTSHACVNQISGVALITVVVFACSGCIPSATIDMSSMAGGDETGAASSDQALRNPGGEITIRLPDVGSLLRSLFSQSAELIGGQTGGVPLSSLISAPTGQVSAGPVPAGNDRQGVTTRLIVECSGQNLCRTTTH